MLTVLIPCYNEKHTILEIIDRVLKVKIIKLEIIVIDDGSIDGSNDILKKYVVGKYDNVKVIFCGKNQGKGRALKEAYDYINGDYVIIQDADLEYNPEDYPYLLKPLLDGVADVVYGSRFVGDKPHRVGLFWHFIANKFLTFFSNMLSNLNLTDMEVGYKIFNTKIFKKIDIKEKSFGVEPEITAKIAKLKIRIFEVGISYSGRTYDEGKKIGLKDGFRALYCIIRYNLFN